MLLLRKGNAKEYQELSAAVVAEMFGVPLKKLVKTPVFELMEDKIHQKAGQSKEISGPAGASVPATFSFKHAESSTSPKFTYELRYAESSFPQEKGDKLVDVYEPRKVTFLGNVTFIDFEKEDLLVYMYLFPWCANSPFKSEAVSTPHWYFKDVEQLADNDVSKFDKLGECITNISGYSGEALRILAKGFDITGTEQMGDSQIKSQLLTKAQFDPATFLQKSNSQLTQFKGIAVNAVDKGMFVVKGVGSGRAWFWNSGTKKGKIVEIFDNGTPELEQFLQYVNTNIHEYFGQIVDALKDAQAQTSAERFLSAQAPIDLAGMFNTAPQTQPVNTPVDNGIGGGTDEVQVKETFIEPEVFPETPAPIAPVETVNTPVVETNTPPAVSENTETQLPDFMKGKGKAKP